MTGLPEFGARLRVWPFPGRRVQKGARPVDALGGGAWLKDGEEVIWSAFHLAQYQQGDLLLHDPEPVAEALPTALPAGATTTLLHDPEPVAETFKPASE